MQQQEAEGVLLLAPVFESYFPACSSCVSSSCACPSFSVLLSSLDWRGKRGSEQETDSDEPKRFFASSSSLALSSLELSDTEVYDP